MVVLVYQEIGRAESVWGGICWYRVNIGPSCIYVIHGTVEIWSSVTNPHRWTHSKDRAAPEKLERSSPNFFVQEKVKKISGYYVLEIKMALYCQQGSDTLRQQLLKLHGVAWYCMVLHGIAWYCMVLHGIA